MVVVGLVAGVLSSMRAPLYQATARVLLTPNDPTQQLKPSAGNGVVGNDPDRYVAGQLSIVESEAVAREAVKSLPGVSVTDVEAALSTGQLGQSNVIRISAKDRDPRRARDIANAVATGYIENRRLSAVSGLQRAADDIEAKLTPLQAQIAKLDAQINDGSTVPGATSTLTSPVKPGSSTGPVQAVPQVPAGSSDPGGGPSTQEALKAARYAAAVQYEALYSREQELLVDISLKRGDAELIAEAKVPKAPVSPHPKRDAALGVSVGLLLGVGIAVARERLGDRVRSAHDVERLTGLPVLAQLPFDDEADKHRGEVATVANPSGALSEAIRSLRTSVQYLGVDSPVKVILVTSAAPGEGKSLVAANLAAAFAFSDRRTILISADLRRSSIDDLFGDASASAGLSGVLTGLASANGHAMHANGHGATSPDQPLSIRALHQTVVPNLCLLPSGPTPPNPAELLGSRRMSALLAEYGAGADIVVIDTPPLLPVTDAAVLAGKCDGVVLVTALNESRRGGVQRANAILDGAGARLLGTVVNKMTKSQGYYDYNSKYYGSRTNGHKSRGRKKEGSSGAPESTDTA